MSSSPQSVKGVLEAAAGYLSGQGIEAPRLAAELLLSRLLACRRLDLYLRFDETLDEGRVKAMRRGIRRVAAGEPVQYVVGQTEFMGHTLKVDRRALIPRPETEVLVEQVLECEPLWSRGAPKVVDLGTGCGCIAISLALARTGCVVLALDTSEEALALARENAESLEVADRIRLAGRDLADLVDAESCDALVANLPYVATPEYERLPATIRDFEPRSALDGGPDGLDAIRAAVQDASIVLKPGGWLFLEIGETQGQRVSDLMREAAFEQVRVSRDLADRERVVSGALPE
jgi:release factor glutamine methyltransferase